MTQFLKYISCLSLGIILGNASKANDICDCISTLTYPAPNNQVRYVARCYLNGEKKEVVEERTFNNQEEADQRTTSLLKAYNIQKNACIALPNGKMIKAPPK